MIGRNLAAYLRAQAVEQSSSIKSVGISHINLAQEPDASSEWIQDFQTVYFLAGITSHREFTASPDYSTWINSHQTIRWLKFLEDGQRVIVFPSTSLIYGGKTDRASETSPANPQGLYAQAKLKVEDYLLDSSTNAKIVRLTKVVSANQPLLSNWIRRLSRNLRIIGYTNSSIAPLHVKEVVSVLSRVAGHEQKGIWNISSAESSSLYDYAVRIATHFGHSPDLVSKSICDETLTVLQNYSLLNCEKARADFGFIPPPLMESIRGFEKEILA